MSSRPDIQGVWVRSDGSTRNELQGYLSRVAEKLHSIRQVNIRPEQRSSLMETFATMITTPSETRQLLSYSMASAGQRTPGNLRPRSKK
jgi:hypothetical protein